MIFANSLDPDQAQQNIKPDLDSKFDILRVLVFLKEKSNLKSADDNLS